MVISLGQHFPFAPPHCVAAGVHCAKLIMIMPSMMRKYTTEITHIIRRCVLSVLSILARRIKTANFGTMMEKSPGMKATRVK